jgi:hypothetical protein
VYGALEWNWRATVETPIHVPVLADRRLRAA